MVQNVSSRNIDEDDNPRGITKRRASHATSAKKDILRYIPKWIPKRMSWREGVLDGWKVEPIFRQQQFLTRTWFSTAPVEQLPVGTAVVHLYPRRWLDFGWQLQDRAIRSTFIVPKRIYWRFLHFLATHCGMISYVLLTVAGYFSWQFFNFQL